MFDVVGLTEGQQTREVIVLPAVAVGTFPGILTTVANRSTRRVYVRGTVCGEGIMRDGGGIQCAQVRALSGSAWMAAYRRGLPADETAMHVGLALFAYPWIIANLGDTHTTGHWNSYAILPWGCLGTSKY